MSQGGAADHLNAQDQRRAKRALRQHQADSQKVREKRMRLFMGAGTLILVAIIVAVAVFRGQSPSAGGALVNPSALNPSSKQLAVGSVAPDFNLATADGQHVQLSSLRGHTVVLEFFAVWCPHCQNEAPILNQVDSTFGPKGEKTLAILANPYGKNYDQSQGTDLTVVTQSDISWFESKFGVKHPTLIDPSFQTVNRYGVTGYPLLYVIDGKGIVRFVQSGDTSFAALSSAINSATA